jgi:hypothetical protein
MFSGMEWFDWLTGLTGIVIAVIAVVLSLIAVLVQRRHQRHTTFQQIHDVLMTAEHQRGRWLMWDVVATGRLPDVGSPDYYLINRALGMLNLLALYTQQGLVPRQWVLELWHHPLTQMDAAVTLLMRERVAIAGWRPWPQLDRLIREAVTYRSTEGCCLATPEPPPPAPAPG